MVEFDLSQLKKYSERIKAGFENERNAFLEEAARMIGHEFLVRVQQRTPKGKYGDTVEFTTNPREKTKEVSFTTKDGKSVFFIAKNPPKVVSFKSKLAGKDGGTLFKAWTIKSIVKVSDGIEITVHNPLDYGEYVEYGHRIANKKGGPTKGFVRGKFMKKNTEIEITFIMQELLEEYYEQFLKKVLEIE